MRPRDGFRLGRLYQANVFTRRRKTYPNDVSRESLQAGVLQSLPISGSDVARVFGFPAIGVLDDTLLCKLQRAGGGRKSIPREIIFGVVNFRSKSRLASLLCKELSFHSQIHHESQRHPRRETKDVLKKESLCFIFKCSARRTWLCL